ncbi:carbohydrate ABC transporter permease [Marasmitruncus massiliensis]|uniref:carbohydrate ABC transporter permease n=1 Tax=Marasmitruncus massiliensis TaxID=1944642 RepID=UPI000C795FB3|nr:carbohydrate ABC transporter permease [Marasmitruncus massiliensis]
MNTTNRLFAKRKALCFSGEFLKYLAILFIFLFLLFPVYWMVVTSLKINTESYRMVPTLWPQNVSFEGYLTLLKDGKFFVYYKNNLIISALAAAIICFISVFAGYALSRFHFKWNKILFAAFAFAQMMPVISRLISLYTILRKLNLTDTHLGLVLAISATQVPFTVSLMASFFDGIPRDLEEAASVDGSKRLQTLFRIIIPLVVPGLLAVGVYSFLMTWDDYLHAITLIRSPELWTLSQGLKLTYLGEVSDWQLINSASTLGTVPMIFVFFFFQKYMIKGLVSGAVKG